MRIEAINEQLLRAIGAGVALLEPDDLTVRFQSSGDLDQMLLGCVQTRPWTRGTGAWGALNTPIGDSSPLSIYLGLSPASGGLGAQANRFLPRDER